jgi:ribosomal protein L2
MIPFDCRVDSVLGTKDDQHMDKRRLVEQEKLELQKTKSRSRAVQIGSVSKTTVNDVTWIKAQKYLWDGIFDTSVGSQREVGMLC